MSHVLVNAIFVVETLLSLSGMLLAVTASRCADPPAEELPLPLLRLCLSSEGEIGPGELSTCKNFYVSCMYIHGPAQVVVVICFRIRIRRCHEMQIVNPSRVSVCVTSFSFMYRENPGRFGRPS